MFSSKENANILTALLVAYGVKHVVVCPGSRNALLVHNFNECDSVECHPVTDERSAGFVALGLSHAVDSPVAVCVTSGSALLNVLPAAAEATYQNKGIVVVSADRPQAWIGQLDGQTLPQSGALGEFVAKSVSLPEITDDESRWYCRRLVCEAMITWMQPSHPSVHINVPLSEPLFDFSVTKLPSVKSVRVVSENDVVERLQNAERPLLICGQLTNAVESVSLLMERLSSRMAVVCETLSSLYGRSVTDIVVSCVADRIEEYKPDVLMYIGGNTVSKRLRKLVREFNDAEVIMVNEKHELHDVTTNATMLHVTMSNESLLGAMDLALKNTDTEYAAKWNELYVRCRKSLEGYVPEYSQVKVVHALENLLPGLQDTKVFYANSTSVRLGDIFAKHYIFCNRGVNGIEGSLSTAVGFSLGTDMMTLCVIGDLSYFYDQNALWNNCLRKNMRILLLNNGCGGIFHQLNGLNKSEAMREYVSAEHKTTAVSCVSYGVDYKDNTNDIDLMDSLLWLLDETASTPRLLEVFTDVNEDSEEYKKLYNMVKNELDKDKGF